MVTSRDPGIIFKNILALLPRHSKHSFCSAYVGSAGIFVLARGAEFEICRHFSCSLAHVLLARGAEFAVRTVRRSCHNYPITHLDNMNLPHIHSDSSPCKQRCSLCDSSSCKQRCSLCDSEKHAGLCALLEATFEDDMLLAALNVDDDHITPTSLETILDIKDKSGEYKSEQRSLTLATDWTAPDVAPTPIRPVLSNEQASPQESTSERKRKKEKERRNAMNEGFDQLSNLILCIDPQLKSTCTARARDTKPSNTGNAHLLSRVELVATAVATLAHVHHENEIHKSIIEQHVGQLASSLSTATSANIVYPSLPDKLAKCVREASSASSTDSEGETQEVSISEKKRYREQKRRNAVNKGLDQLAELLFLIDPQLKATAIERAGLDYPKGRASKSECHLLSRTELVNLAAVALARIHQDNEAHKGIIARLSNGNGGQAPPLAVLSNTVRPRTSPDTVTAPDFDTVFKSVPDFSLDGDKEMASLFHLPQDFETMALTAPTTSLVNDSIAYQTMTEEQKVEAKMLALFQEETMFTCELNADEPPVKRQKQQIRQVSL